MSAIDKIEEEAILEGLEKAAGKATGKEAVAVHAAGWIFRHRAVFTGLWHILRGRKPGGDSLDSSGPTPV